MIMSWIEILGFEAKVRSFDSPAQKSLTLLSYSVGVRRRHILCGNIHPNSNIERELDRHSQGESAANHRLQ